MSSVTILQPKSGGEFSFDESTHIYRLNGNVIPGFHGIADGVGIVSDFLRSERALARGKNGHQYAQIILNGEIDDYDIPETDKPWVEAIQEIIDQEKIVLGYSEVAICHPKLRYGCTLDCLDKEGRLWDWKFWKALTKYGLDLAGMQLAGYKEAVREQFGYVPRRYLIHFNQISPVKVVAHKISMHEPKHWHQFVSILNTYRIKEEHRLLKEGTNE